MPLPDFFSLQGILMLTFLFFVIICGRYFLLSGFFYLFFYKWRAAHYARKKLNQKAYKNGQLKKEIKWSCINAFIFSVIGAFTFICWQKGLLKVYLDWHLSDIFYLPLSILIYLILQETYYYWLHRWMHHPSVFRHVHLIHHESKISSPFTAFSFHPYEGILQAIFLPILLFFIPIHLYALILILIIMSITSVINHLDIEIYPQHKFKILGKFIIGASHHALHHSHFKYNFGLYFTFWDRYKKTESPHFEQIFSGESSSVSPKS